VKIDDSTGLQLKRSCISSGSAHVEVTSSRLLGCCFVILRSSSSCLALPGNCNVSRGTGPAGGDQGRRLRVPDANDTKHRRWCLAMRHRMRLALDSRL